MGEIFLLGDIAGTLPSANFGRLAGDGGTVQLVMYADTGARPPEASAAELLDRLRDIPACRKALGSNELLK